MILIVRKRSFEHMRSVKIQISLRFHAIFTGCILDSQDCKIPSCGQRKLRSDCADQSFRWPHISKGSYVSYYTFLLFLFIFCIKPALECYHCDQAVMNFTDCNTTRVCNKGEVGMDEIRVFMHLNTVELQ